VRNLEQLPQKNTPMCRPTAAAPICEVLNDGPGEYPTREQRQL